MGTRENKVERLLVREVERRGGLCLKWTGTSGVPDRIVILPGYPPFAVEVKTYDGVLSSVQKRMHDRLRTAGMKVVTAYGAEGVRSAIPE